MEEAQTVATREVVKVRSIDDVIEVLTWLRDNPGTTLHWQLNGSGTWREWRNPGNEMPVVQIGDLWCQTDQLREICEAIDDTPLGPDDVSWLIEQIQAPSNQERTWDGQKKHG